MNLLPNGILGTKVKYVLSNSSKTVSKKISANARLCNY